MITAGVASRVGNGREWCITLYPTVSECSLRGYKRIKAFWTLSTSVCFTKPKEKRLISTVIFILPWPHVVLTLVRLYLNSGVVDPTASFSSIERKFNGWFCTVQQFNLKNCVYEFGIQFHFLGLKLHTDIRLDTTQLLGCVTWNGGPFLVLSHSLMQEY